MSPSFNLERASGFDYVVGIDEAGCGPWAGPVTVAAVVFPKKDWDTVEKDIPLDDSKKLSSQKRAKLFDLIKESALGYGIASTSAEEIDQMNIVKAVALATERALQQITCPIEYLFIDGIRNPKLSHPTKMIIKGDSQSCSIAAASILAKVTRDLIMTDLAREYTAYGWERNAGYGTKLHQEALLTHGVTPYHRKSYAPIKKLINNAA